MSYSRWSNSEFYTYRESTGLDGKDDQVLSCWWSLDLVHRFMYSEVVDLVNDRSTLQRLFNGILSEELTDELIGYMNQFISDVNNEYPENDNEDC
jgi:hypothetical protein